LSLLEWNGMPDATRKFHHSLCGAGLAQPIIGELQRTQNRLRSETGKGNLEPRTGTRNPHFLVCETRRVEKFWTASIVYSV
jgi:hypothetical protein